MKKLNALLITNIVCLILVCSPFSSAQQTRRKAAPATGKTTANPRSVPAAAKDGFPMPPVIPGIWKTLDRQASQILTDQLEKSALPGSKGVAGKITKLRTKQLSFYPAATLCEGVVAADHPDPNGTITFVAFQGGVVLFDGTSVPVRDLNKRLLLSIDTKEKAQEYVRFYTALVFGAEGSFRIIDSVSNLGWEQSATEEEKRKVGGIIQPFLATRLDDMRWQVTATVQYSSALYNVVFFAKPSGEVEMADDTPIAVDLPLRRQRFAGHLRREVVATRDTNKSQFAPAPSSPRTVVGGVLNGKAVSLPKPAYPKEAMTEGIGGSVSVQVLIDTDGKVLSASAVSGDKLLRPSAEIAARNARFSPTLLSGQPVKVSGVITYNFVAGDAGVSFRNAAVDGNLAVVLRLLERGVDLDGRSEDGITALMKASANGRLSVVQALIGKGANVDLQDKDGDTALIYAAHNESVPIMQALIAKGADVNRQNNKGVAALMIVDTVPAARFLISKGADVSAKNKTNGWTALMYAKTVPMAEILILKGARVNATTNDGATPLTLASVLKRPPALTEFLLAKGANVYAVDDVGNSALAWAKLTRQDALVAILEAETRKPCPANLLSEHSFRLSDRVRTDVRINRNDRISFSATGTISFGINARVLGPDGWESDRNSDYERLEGYPFGGVLATFSETEGWHFIGKADALTSRVNGTLQLAVNDNEPETNRGYFEVKVSICRAR